MRTLGRNGGFRKSYFCEGDSEVETNVDASRKSNQKDSPPCLSERALPWGRCVCVCVCACLHGHTCTCAAVSALRVPVDLHVRLVLCWDSFNVSPEWHHHRVPSHVCNFWKILDSGRLKIGALQERRKRLWG